jgi:hypothetical protein
MNALIGQGRMAPVSSTRSFAHLCLRRNTETKNEKKNELQLLCFFQNDLPSRILYSYPPLIMVKELLNNDEPLQRFLTTCAS